MTVKGTHTASVSLMMQSCHTNYTLDSMSALSAAKGHKAQLEMGLEQPVGGMQHLYTFEFIHILKLTTV